MHTVYFETYGCQMNVADSDLLAELLAKEGYRATGDASLADLVIVNTCSVRERAESRARARITELANAKVKRKRFQQLWVVGCMAQRLGNRLRDQIRGVDRVIGAVDMETIRDRIGDYLEQIPRSVVDVSAGGGPSRFVPVMRGCDNYCAYCIVPYVRGREHSIPAAQIEQTVVALLAQGTKEVTLLGQNVNSYRDPMSNADFARLLERLHDIQELRRIRFTTSHPKDCGEDLMRTVANLPKVCKHLHLPVQSGSTRVLALMNRGYTRDDYLRIVEHMRRHVPDVDITTDVMTGFPGETARDFEETLSLFRTVRFTTAFMFAFSPREGTAAATMADPIPTEITKERLRVLIDLQTAITREHYQASVGKRVELLITGRQTKPGGKWMGQDYGSKRALLSCSGSPAGTILPATVVATSGMTLLCES